MVQLTKRGDMERVGRGVKCLYTAVMLAAAHGCGDGNGLVAVEREEDETGRPVLSGTVIASDSFDVIPVQTADLSNPAFLVTHPWFEMFQTSMGDTAGRLLVLSVRDLSRPSAICGPGDFTDDCAIMVVLERSVAEPGRRPGRLKVETQSGQITLFPWPDFRLQETPPPD